MLRLPVLPRLPVATAAVAVAVVAALAVAVCAEYAPVDGRGNNVMEPGRGATLSPFQAGAFHTTYSDGVSALADGPPAREVSNVVFGTKSFQYNRYEVSYMNAVWGQFVAHDMVLTAPNAAAPEEVPIHVPTCDAFMDAECEGNKTFPFVRTQADPSTGTSTSNPRVQLNAQTAYLDASTVYGPDVERLALLRTFYKGTLKADLRDGCPHNHLGHFQAGPTPATAQRLTGDVRGNVNPGLLALHGVWVLEHNRLCGVLSSEHADWTDEELFQEARKRVVGMIQAITVYEYLPRTMGRTLGQYGGYDPSADASVDPLFGIAAYRYGHSGINAMYLRSNSDGSPHPAGPLLLRDSYFQPERYLNQGGIAPILRGLLYQPEADIDTSMVDDVRNFLINLRDDLAAQDIMRGRDFGLPKYGAARRLYGLPVPATWEDMTPDIQVQAALAELYASPEEVDLWVGGLCELPEQAPSMVGPLFAAIIEAQFERARAGDRFWFEGSEYSAELSAELAGTRLADVLARTVGVAVPAGTSAFDLIEVASSPAPGAAASPSPEAVPSSASGTAQSPSPSPASQDSTAGVGSTPSQAAHDSTAPAAAASVQLAVNDVLSLEYTPISLTTTTVDLTFTLQGTGWIGFGVGNGMTANTDMLLMCVKDGEGEVIDALATAYAMPAPDAEQNVELLSHSEVGGVTVVSVRRPVLAAEATDRPLSSSGPTKVVFAWSLSSDSYGYHGANRMTARLDLTVANAGNASIVALGSDASPVVFGFHGLSMASSFLGIIPAALLYARYGKQRTVKWQSVHKSLMLLAGTIVLPAAGAAVSSSTGSAAAKTHSTIGVTIATAFLVQMLVGASTRQSFRSSSTPALFAFVLRIFHRVAGPLIFVFGLYNCRTGTLLMFPSGAVFVDTWLCFIAIGAVLLEAQLWSRKKVCEKDVLAAVKVITTMVKHEMTHDDIQRSLRGGQKLVLLGGAVFDVTTLIKSHPGGAFLIAKSLGRDISPLFFGAQKLHGASKTHLHTAQAWAMLKNVCIGKLRDDNAEAPAWKLDTQWNVVSVKQPNVAHAALKVTLRPVLVGPRNGPPDTWPMRSFGQTRFAATSRTADSARQRVCVVRQPNSPDAIAYLTGEAGALGPELTRNKVLFTTSSQDPSLGLRHQRQDGWIVAYVHYTHVARFFELIFLLEHRHQRKARAHSICSVDDPLASPSNQRLRRTSAAGFAPGSANRDSKLSMSLLDMTTLLRDEKGNRYRARKARHLSLSLVVYCETHNQVPEAQWLLTMDAALPTFKLSVFQSAPRRASFVGPSVAPQSTAIHVGVPGQETILKNIPPEDLTDVLVVGPSAFRNVVHPLLLKHGFPEFLVSDVF